MALSDPPLVMFADDATAVFSWRSVVFTVWSARPLTVEGAKRQARACEECGKRVGAGKLVEIVLLHDDTPIAEGPVRDALHEAAGRVTPYYACVATLFKGRGFRAAIIRGVLTSLQLVSRTSFAQKVFDDEMPCVEFAVEHAKKSDKSIDAATFLAALESVRAQAKERRLWD